MNLLTFIYKWLIIKEIELMILYEEELCENMQFDFDNFCRIIYNGGTITYTL